MQRIALPDPCVEIQGAVGGEQRHDGYVPRRLNDTWRYQFPVEVDVLAASPSGVRLRFVTDSKTVGVELHATHFRLGSGDGFPTRLDLVQGNEFISAVEFTEGNAIVVEGTALNFVPGEATTVMVDVPNDGLVEIWLPNNSIVALQALQIDDGASLTAAPVDTRRKWVHHGSSISHCLEAYGGSRTWPATAARLADVNVTNIGLGGQCHIDQFTARTMRDLDADLLSLKVGINIVNGDTLRMRTFGVALHGFLDTIREGHPDTPFLVISPILCPAHEDHAGPTDGSSGTSVALGTEITQAQGALTLRQIRKIVSDVVRARVAAGDTNLHYLDGRELFGEDDLADLPDGLHPNGDGYMRMGERFARIAFTDGGVFAS